MIKYRPEIDGLRALAVLPILLYHSGVKAIPGGFTGVDIFFVISGFLITSILLQQNSSNTFSIINFYGRRMRRIMPALLVMLAITLTCGYFLLLKDEYIGLAKSTLAALFFIPNIYFYSSIGYFGIDAATTPLLHTWSLGVEEQFYIIFPILLYATIKLVGAKRSFFLLVLLAAISFTLNIKLVNNSEDFTFYMLPTRAWELLCGAILAFTQIPKAKSKLLAEIASITGLILILYGLFFITEKMPFPGLNACFSVIGTVLIIWSTTNCNTCVTKILVWRPLVFTGLISYSLYLWHWPVTVYLGMLTKSKLLTFVIIIISYILAVLSYYFIEQPFRRKVSKLGAKRLIYSCFAVTAVIVAACITTIKTSGMTFRMSDEVGRHSKMQKFLHKKRYCQIKSLKHVKNGKYCNFGTPNLPPSFVLLGDSHADALRTALGKAAMDVGVSGLQLSSEGCRPLYGVYNKNKSRCREFMQLSVNLINSLESVHTVFLAGYWRVSLTGESYRYKNYIIRNEHTDNTSIANNAKFFYQGLNDTINALSAKRIVFVGQVPEIEINPRKEYARSILLGQSNYSRSVEVASTFYDQLKSEVMQKYIGKMEYLDLYEIICPKQQCQLFSENRPIYRDGDHLSRHGAELLAPYFLPFL